MPSLTTIIVSYNTKPELEACLTSLEAAPPSCPHEIIVVDNASTDGSADMVRRRFPRVRLIEPGVNLGFGAANNLGFRASGADLCLLLNSDTLVSPGALDTMVTALASMAGVAALGPRIVDGEGRAEWSFGQMIGPGTECVRRWISRAYDHRVPWAVRLIEGTTRRPGRPDWVTGACLMVWRADASAAGFFDERFFLYNEDVDFCAALRALGRGIVFLPTAQIVHLKGRSGRQRPETTERAYRHSQILFYRKHHPAWLPLLRVFLRARGKLPTGA